MPIATRRRGRIGRPGLVHWTAARRSTSGAAPRRGMCGKAKAGDGDSCSSSSIGQDSDNVAGGSASEGEESRETEMEMESGSKGPLDTLEALEESLPMRRGLSGFYAGRSRSFQNLTDAEACSSAGEIGKPENAYTRKRRNQLASSIVQEKSHNDETGGSNEDRSPKRHAAAGGSTVTTCTITSGGSAGYDATAIEEARDPTQSSPPGLLREEVGNTSAAATTEEEQDPAQFPPPGRPQEESGNTSAAAAAATDEEGDPASVINCSN